MAAVTLVLVALLIAGPVAAQEASKPDDPAQLKEAIVELKALAFALQTKLVAVEKELGDEKSRRAALESEQLLRARETLDPSIKRKLGLPVPEAPKTEKPVPPQTPPKE
jgi:hypothetical protein